MLQFVEYDELFVTEVFLFALGQVLIVALSSNFF